MLSPMLSCLQCADVVFISPPWGGPGYSSSQVFDLPTMVPIDGFKVFQVAHEVTENIAYYVPRNVDVQQVSDSPCPSAGVCGQRLSVCLCSWRCWLALGAQWRWSSISSTAN